MRGGVPESRGRWLPMVLMGLVLLLWARPGHADEDPGAKARRLYQEGSRLYNLGQYATAVQAFEDAYALSGAAPLLFNIAQAKRLEGPEHCDEAQHAYERYLREDPNASNQAEVQQRILEMQACAERARKALVEQQARQRPPAPTPPPPPPPLPLPPPAPHVHSAAPVILTALGG